MITFECFVIFATQTLPLWLYTNYLPDLLHVYPSLDHKRHKCLDLVTQHDIVYHHVIFYEEHFPYSKFHLAPPTSDHDSLASDDDISSSFPNNNTNSSSPSIVFYSSLSSPISSHLTSTTMAPTSPSALVDPSLSPLMPTGHRMITRSRTGSLKPSTLMNLFATDVSPILRSTV